jgi:hypothetical protein
MEVIQVFDRPASRSFYTVAGRFLFIEVVDLRLAQLVQQLFAGWQLTPTSPPPRDAEIEIKFFGDEPGPDVPGNLNGFDVAEGGRCHVDANAYYLQFDNSSLRLRHDVPVRVDVWIREVPQYVDAELARVTSFAVCAALRRFGLFDLHSAGVVEPQSGAGVLIVGPSGSGKSTLTFQLASAGWPYLSDDEVLLSLKDGQVEARGFRSFFALREIGGSTARFAFKNVFDPSDVVSAERASQVAPRWLLFTAISGEKETRMVELSQADTMVRLIRACPWATYDTTVAGPNLELLSRLARQAKAFDLAAGSDLLEPTRAAEFLKTLNEH